MDQYCFVMYTDITPSPHLLHIVHTGPVLAAGPPPAQRHGSVLPTPRHQALHLWQRCRGAAKRQVSTRGRAGGEGIVVEGRALSEGAVGHESVFCEEEAWGMQRGRVTGGVKLFT